MSAIESGRRRHHDPSTTIATRIGGVIAAALVVSVAINVFAGSLAFAILLAGLAAHAAWGPQRGTTPTAKGRRPAADDAPVEQAVAPWETATPPLAPSTPAGGASASS